MLKLADNPPSAADCRDYRFQYFLDETHYKTKLITLNLYFVSSPAKALFDDTFSRAAAMNDR